jgi:Uma2 family endonuclease
MATNEFRSRSRLVLGPDDAGRAVSAEVFAKADYQEPWRYEREGGRLIVMPPDGEGHRETASPWLRKLFSFWDQHPDIVHSVLPSAWVRIDQGTDRIGDIGVILKRGRPSKKIPHRVPDLMFEIVSPGRTSRDRDYVNKRADYERFGVKEYVIVDRFKKQVTVHVRVRGKYQTRVLTAADTYTSRLLPGLAIPLSDVWDSWHS